MADHVIPLPAPVALSQDDQAVRTFTIARTDCEDCPATTGQPCMWRDARGDWHEARVLHIRRTNTARRLISDETSTPERAERHDHT